MDCPVASLAAAAGEHFHWRELGVADIVGYPIATMPMGVLKYNGRPFAMGIIAQAGREDLMFQFMSAWEAVFPPRHIPARLLEYEESENDKDGSSLVPKI